jgi:hypothetical protein
MGEKVDSQSQGDEEDSVYGYLITIGHSQYNNSKTIGLSPSGEPNTVYTLKKKKIANGVNQSDIFYHLISLA